MRHRSPSVAISTQTRQTFVEDEPSARWTTVNQSSEDVIRRPDAQQAGGNTVEYSNDQSERAIDLRKEDQSSSSTPQTSVSLPVKENISPKIASADELKYSRASPDRWRMRRISTDSEKQTTAIAYHPHGKQFASVSYDGLVTLWDTTSGSWIRSFSSISGQASAMTYSPGGKELAFGEEQGRISIWDPKRGGLIKQWRDKKTYADVIGIAWAPGGRHIASVTEDQADTTIKIWDASTGALFAELQGHQKATTVIAYSPDGTTLASAGDDFSIRIWDPIQGHEKTAKYYGREDHLEAGPAYLPDGKRVAFGLGDERGLSIKIWNLETDKVIESLPHPGTNFSALACSPNGQEIAYITFLNTLERLTVWDLATGEVVTTSRALPGVISRYGLKYSPDGEQIASLCVEGAIVIWEKWNSRRNSTENDTVLEDKKKMSSLFGNMKRLFR